MKKLIFLIAICLCGVSSIAQENQNSGSVIDPIVYCVIIVEGQPLLIENWKQVTQDVTLKNGTIVRTDGTVEKKDHTTLVLK